MAPTNELSHPPDDVLLHALPIFHAHGLFVATNVILMTGASMIFIPKFDPNEVFRLLPRQLRYAVDPQQGEVLPDHRTHRHEIFQLPLAHCYLPANPPLYRCG